ncbi:MAG: biopolymer transporter ExbD [Crocinitomicaceae bacterium]|nr:biopolymer transporter ExbD [Crocinitomicaceae bacterium]
MKLRRRKRHGAEVSTHSLNDIMFFLLLFFLIISTMANPNVIKVLLPEAKDNKEKEAQKTLQLTVDASKTYYLDGIVLDADQLDRRLSAVVKNNPDAACSINMDRSLSVQDLVDVMQIGAKNNVKMYLKTERPS